MLDHTIPAFDKSVLNHDQLLTDLRVHVMECVCPKCGGTVVGFTQPPLVPGRPARYYLNCVTDTCPGATTLTAADWFALTLPCVDMRAGAAAVHAGGAVR